MGKAPDVMWSEIINNKNLSLTVNEMVKLNNEESRKYFISLPLIEPIPGVIKQLKELKNKDIPMAVASSSDQETIEIIMDKSGLGKYFQHVISSDQIGKSKPEPDIFLYTAKLLGFGPESCMVIEDSNNGIKAAKAANIYCVAFSGASSDNQDQSMADIRIGTFPELRNVVKRFFEL
jgi:HAD superfamily hydrolase (TIGR01509 family)